MSVASLSGTAAARATSARGVLLCAEDADAGWCRSLAGEGLEACTDDAAQPVDAVLLHVSGALPSQLPRLRQARAAWPTLPLVAVVRGLRDLDQILALEMGADDVVDEAVPPAVLAARLRALWRRGRPVPETPRRLRYGALALDLDTRRVEHHGRAVPLTEGEFEVLWLLASQPGRVLSRVELLKRLRGLDDPLLDRSIDSRIYRIRAKLGDHGASPRIRTVRNRGYLFAAEGW